MSKNHTIGSLETYEPEDKSFNKHITQQGQGDVTPNPGSVCVVHLMSLGEYEIPNEEMGGYVFNEECEITIGEGDTLLSEHFDKVIMSMRESETSYVKSKINTDGEKVSEFDSGKPALKFNATLKSISRAADSSDLEQDERLERAQSHKNRGTELYQKGRIDFAVKRFNNALLCLKDMEPTDGLNCEMQQQYKLLSSQCHLNLAAAFLKSENFPKAIEECTAALELDPENVKGLFRRGQAYSKLHKYDEAKLDLNKALKHDAENKAVISQLRTVDAQIKKEKQLYKKMFA